MDFSIDAQRFNSIKNKTLIIPISTIEQHGPHLPMDTNMRITARLASDITKFLSEKYDNLFHKITFNISTVIIYNEMCRQETVTKTCHMSPTRESPWRVVG
jgi:creatinine amidohydrolase/Fe(II)-dependent formamide hydrolase-like protein